MDNQLQKYASDVIDWGIALLNQQDGELTDKQREVIKIIIANAEHFIHVCADFQITPLEQFFATMSHEFCTPLTPIRGYSELLMMGAIGSLNDKQRTYVREICESTNHLRVGVQNILEETRKKMAAAGFHESA